MADPPDPVPRPKPLVSVVLATRDRPRLVRLAIAFYRAQTYDPRELIVVDDGARFPVSPELPAVAGGRLIRMPSGTPLGIKLNAGVAAAHGELCLKMDDDDWYAPDFLRRMVAAHAADQVDFCRPRLTCVEPFPVFDIARWDIRAYPGVAGGTLLFAAHDWSLAPFRPVPRSVDAWFLRDQAGMGVSVQTLPVTDLYVAVRHRGAAGDQPHTWSRLQNGQSVEAFIERQGGELARPEAIFPPDALATYHEIRAALARQAFSHETPDARRGSG